MDSFRLPRYFPIYRSVFLSYLSIKVEIIFSQTFIEMANLRSPPTARPARRQSIPLLL
ncbi:hypothetical protein Bca4012_028019 [Brassica carinata]